MGANCSALISFCNDEMMSCSSSDTDSDAEDLSPYYVTCDDSASTRPTKYIAFKKANHIDFILFQSISTMTKTNTRQFFIKQPNIIKWIYDLYDPKISGNQWTQWFVYNDVHEYTSPATSPDVRGVARGILTWNEKRIGWMQHTVPDWPGSFDEKCIQQYDCRSQFAGEHSFHYVEFDYDADKIENITRHLRAMNVRPVVQSFVRHDYSIHWNPVIENLEIIPGLFHILKKKLILSSGYDEPDKHYSVLLSDGRRAYWLGHGCGGFLCEDDRYFTRALKIEQKKSVWLYEDDCYSTDFDGLDCLKGGDFYRITINNEFDHNEEKRKMKKRKTIT
jgi:hypothetical protein